MEHLILILRKHLNMLKCTMKELEEIVLNGTTIINQPKVYGSSYYNKPASGIIPVSYIKNFTCRLTVR